VRFTKLPSMLFRKDTLFSHDISLSAIVTTITHYGGDVNRQGVVFGP
jgi:hypothetical protein